MKINVNPQRMFHVILFIKIFGLSIAKDIFPLTRERVYDQAVVNCQSMSPPIVIGYDRIPGKKESAANFRDPPDPRISPPGPQIPPGTPESGPRTPDLAQKPPFRPQIWPRIGQIRPRTRGLTTGPLAAPF